MENSELLERFLPGYRIVCRIFARYLGIDLTDFMSKAFVLFAVVKSAQYLWSSLSGLGGALTSSVEVPEGDLQRDVLRWVDRSRAGRRAEVVMSVTLSKHETEQEEPPGRRIAYGLAFNSTIYFLHNYRVMTLRRQHGKPPTGDTILLMCIGLSTDPLRNFLEESVQGAGRGKSIESKSHGNGKAG